MTADESLQAFVAFYPNHDDGDCWRRCALKVWQASAKYHTERERERCAALCRKARDNQQLFLAVPIEASARWEVAEECALLIEQEPKP